MICHSIPNQNHPKTNWNSPRPISPDEHFDGWISRRIFFLHNDKKTRFTEAKLIVHFARLLHIAGQKIGEKREREGQIKMSERLQHRELKASEQWPPTKTSDKSNQGPGPQASRAFKLFLSHP